MSDTFDRQKAILDQAFADLKALGYIYQGATEDEIQHLMASQNVTSLPDIYLYFLRIAGKWIGSSPKTEGYARGKWVIRDHYLIDEITDDELKEYLFDVMKEHNVSFTLPDDFFIWSMHAGYEFLLFKNTTPDTFDAWVWSDGDSEPDQLIDGLPGYIRGWVDFDIKRRRLSNP
jgi:hypothetical protein